MTRSRPDLYVLSTFALVHRSLPLTGRWCCRLLPMRACDRQVTTTHCTRLRYALSVFAATRCFQRPTGGSSYRLMQRQVYDRQVTKQSPR